MRSQRSPLPWLVPGLLLLFLTLRPVPALEGLIQVGLAPLRKLGELAAPLVMLRGSASGASEESLRQAAIQEEAAGAQLLEDLARGALPTEPELLQNRRIVHGAVIGRLRDSPDFLRVELRDVRGVREGYPVAAGNSYVGRVASVDASQSLAIVELVTGASFHVGGVARQPLWEDGRPDDTPVLMTVGGLFVPSRLGERNQKGHSLAVDHPSDRAIVGGLVRVDERYGEQPEVQRLSLGLHLGQLTKDENYWGIRPELDYRDGLFHVVVLCPPEASLGSELAFESATHDDQWLRVKPIGLGDPSPYRQSAKLRAGRSLGVESGAAVLSLANRLVGRITQAGPWTSDVSFLDDPGFSVVAVASAGDAAEPYVLGRLISMGRQAAGGALLLRWYVRVEPRDDWKPLAQEGSVLARLYTGSGEEGLPSGFAFGNARIPMDARSGQTRELELEVDTPATELRSFFVRIKRSPDAAEGAR